MNSPTSSSSPLIGPRARLFSFVSVKKRWEAADQQVATKAKQIELDITLPKGRERQKTVVFYLNQENGLKLQEVVEESKLSTGIPPPVKKESESAEEPQGRKRSPIVRQSDRHSTFELIERASRIQDDLPQEASPPPKLEGSAISSAPTIITTSAPMTPPPPSKVSPYEPHHEEPAGEGDEGHEHEEGEKVEEREESDADEVEGAKKAERETEYSSEEEVEEEGYLVVRPRRSQTVQRQQVDMPESKEGWGKKCGVEGYRKKTWQRRYFVLQYPFLDIYDKKGGKSKGRISMRGGILVDEELLDDEKKYKKNAKTSLKISADSKHKLILQFKNDKEKKAWARALWSNIYYANPAKQSGGVSYKVIQVNDEKNDFIINTSMAGITLFQADCQQPIWHQPFHHLRTIVLPEKQAGENWITFDFSKYGGAKVVYLDNVPPLVLYKSFQSLFESCTGWQNSSLLQALYGSKQ